MEARKLEDLLQQNLYSYQLAVNEDRALPDATTGLKPVHLRILWGCFDGGYVSGKEYKKSARIVGDVMGKYHPHGDSSIYEALIRLAQNWKMRYPIMDVHGNMGNIDGDGPAAMRYTNARLAKLAEDGMLTNIKKNVVDFIPNYDEDEEEPISLPAIFPNLLCNPNNGIGWAMACEWLPHNLKEVAQAIYDYLDNKEPMLPGPDFPTGGMIYNQKDMEKCYKTGRGTVRIRARYELEKDSIVFYEIPYGTTTEALIEKIIQVAKDSIPEILEVTNESDKKFRLVVKCEKGASLDGIAAKLYAKTALQTTVSFNQVALVGGKPKLINLKEAIEIYIAHNINCIIREAEFDKRKVTDRLHIIEGLIKALEDIDNIIALIKQSSSSADAKEKLIEKYSFSEVQAKAILDMKLSRLAKLEKVELNQEAIDLQNTLNEIMALLNSRELQQEELKKRLGAIVKKYGDERRTVLTNIEIKKEEKEIETVVPEECVVIATQSGEIKRVASKTFKAQKRNGKGVKSEDEAVLDIISTNTVDTLMIFTNKGKMYRLLVDNVPAGTNVSKGTRIGTLVNMEPEEKVIAITSLYRKTDAQFVLFFTKKGLIKKTSLEEYTKVKRSTGIAAINLKDGDSIANVTFVKDEEVLVVTKKGMSIRFTTSDISPIGRVTAGIKSIKLDETDEVIVGLPIHNKNDNVTVFSANGYGKKTLLEEFPLQGRAGKGVMLYKPNSITGDVIGAAMTNEEDNVLIVGKPNSICISAVDIPLLGRVSTGNLMIKGSIIKSVVKL